MPAAFLAIDLSDGPRNLVLRLDSAALPANATLSDVRVALAKQGDLDGKDYRFSAPTGKAGRVRFVGQSSEAMFSVEELAGPGLDRPLTASVLGGELPATPATSAEPIRGYFDLLSAGAMDPAVTQEFSILLRSLGFPRALNQELEAVARPAVSLVSSVGGDDDLVFCGGTGSWSRPDAILVLNDHRISTESEVFYSRRSSRQFKSGVTESSYVSAAYVANMDWAAGGDTATERSSEVATSGAESTSSGTSTSGGTSAYSGGWYAGSGASQDSSYSQNSGASSASSSAVRTHSKDYRSRGALPNMAGDRVESRAMWSAETRSYRFVTYFTYSLAFQKVRLCLRPEQLTLRPEFVDGLEAALAGGKSELVAFLDSHGRCVPLSYTLGAKLTLAGNTVTSSKEVRETHSQWKTAARATSEGYLTDTGASVGGNRSETGESTGQGSTSISEYAGRMKMELWGGDETALGDGRKWLESVSLRNWQIIGYDANAIISILDLLPADRFALREACLDLLNRPTFEDLGIDQVTPWYGLPAGEVTFQAEEQAGWVVVSAAGATTELSTEGTALSLTTDAPARAGLYLTGEGRLALVDPDGNCIWSSVPALPGRWIPLVRPGDRKLDVLLRDAEGVELCVLSIPVPSDYMPPPATEVAMAEEAVTRTGAAYTQARALLDQKLSASAAAREARQRLLLAADAAAGALSEANRGVDTATGDLSLREAERVAAEAAKTVAVAAETTAKEAAARAVVAAKAAESASLRCTNELLALSTALANANVAKTNAQNLADDAAKKLDAAAKVLEAAMKTLTDNQKALSDLNVAVPKPAATVLTAATTAVTSATTAVNTATTARDAAAKALKDATDKVATTSAAVSDAYQAWANGDSALKAAVVAQAQAQASVIATEAARVAAAVATADASQRFTAADAAKSAADTALAVAKALSIRAAVEERTAAQLAASAVTVAETLAREVDAAGVDHEARWAARQEAEDVLDGLRKHPIPTDLVIVGGALGVVLGGKTYVWTLDELKAHRTIR